MQVFKITVEKLEDGSVGLAFDKPIGGYDNIYHRLAITISSEDATDLQLKLEKLVKGAQ